MQKRGQFYLVAAMVLAVLVISLAVISNYSKKNENLRIYDLRDEIDIESKKVLNYALNNEQTPTEIYYTMNDFSDVYIDSGSQDKDFYFIFGTEENLTIKGYQKSATVVELNGNAITSSSGEFNSGINPSGSTITLTVGSNTYEFNLNKGQNFYFVVSQVLGENTYVVEG